MLETVIKNTFEEREREQRIEKETKNLHLTLRKKI